MGGMRPPKGTRMPMAFSDVRLRAQHGFKLVCNACSAISYQASLHRLSGSCGMQ